MSNSETTQDYEMYLAASTVMSTLSLALASQADTRRLANNTLAIADLSIWSVFVFVYIALAIICLIPIRRLPAHRAPFIVLCIASSFTAVQCSISIAYIIYSEGAKIPVSKPYLGQAGALYAASLFFANWTSPFLFIAFVLLFFDRQKHAISPVLRNDNILIFNASIGWSVLLLITGTIMAGLNAVALSDLARTGALAGSVSSADLQKISDAQRPYEIVRYILIGQWFCTGLYFSGLAAYVYRNAWRAGLQNKITDLAIYVLIPLYMLSILETVIFTVALSPATLAEENEVQVLANDIIFNVLRSTIFAVMVSAGLKRVALEEILINSESGAVARRQHWICL